jgi:hypothetical protein
MFVRTRWKPTQPVDALRDTLKPAAWSGVMAERRARHTSLRRLMRREEASLRLSYSIQSLVVYHVMSLRELPGQ